MAPLDGLQHSPSKQRCASCWKENTDSEDSLMQCSGCHFVLYCNSACQTTHWTYHKNLCKLTIALKQDKHDKVLLAFIKQYRALLKPVVKDIPEFCNSSTSGTSSNTNFTTPASIAKIITLEKGTTLNGQPKLEVVEVEDRWLHQIFLRYPEFKAEWNTELAQAKSDLNNNEGICFAILLYRSAARLMTIVSKRGDPLNLLTLPFPTPPETWIGALNSAIEPGRVYKTSNAEYKIEIRNTDVKA